jgi:hypothetical protein
MSGVLIALAMAIIYFLPAATAVSLRHKHAHAILVLNFLLGWTVLGWAIAFIWAYTQKQIEKPQCNLATLFVASGVVVMVAVGSLVNEFKRSRAKESRMRLADSRRLLESTEDRTEAPSIRADGLPAPVPLPPVTPVNHDAVLNFQQQQAARGYPGYQYVMGQRYLTGDGVPQNLGDARQQFELAAAQGNKDAARALSKLNSESASP